MKNFQQTLKRLGWGAISAVFVLQPTLAQAQIQRSFLNPSFETPAYTPLGTDPGCFVQVIPGVVPGWETTHGTNYTKDPGGNCFGWVSPQGKPPLIEIWRKVFSSVNTATNAGDQFAELNAEEDSKLFQKLCLINGERIDFSLLHRGRDNPFSGPVVNGQPTGNAADTAVFEISNIPANPPTNIIVGTFSTSNTGVIPNATPVAGAGATLNTPVAAGNNWVRYGGYVVFSGTTGEYEVGFRATGTSGNNNTRGNFLDQVQFSGKPIIELATTTDGSGLESETNPTTNPPRVRVVGLVPDPGITVPITVVTTNGGTATLGVDYTTPSGTNVINVFVPAGNYDGINNSTFTIPFTVVNDDDSEDDETIIFEIGDPGNTAPYLVGSTQTCNGTPSLTTTYTIIDNDFITGTVWNDEDNSANGTFNNIPSAGELGTNAGGLFAILVAQNGNILSTTPVLLDGTYGFNNVGNNQDDLTIRLSTTSGIVNDPAPATSLPTTPNFWVNTSPLISEPFDTLTSSITGKDFGIAIKDPELLLVKRITAINGTTIEEYVDDTTSPQAANDNYINWPTPIDVSSGISEFLKGVIDGGVVEPGDILEYTIYFISSGNTPVTNVTICDLVPENATFLETAFTGNTPTDGGLLNADLGIALAIGSTTTYLTNAADTPDRGEYFPPGKEPPLPTQCAASNTNGAVVVNVVRKMPATTPDTLPHATAVDITNSHGFIRFRAKVK
ncbi:hypothetical protein VB711_17355 [Cronbergia sp. UHCC 0137]|uniref:hypothetical protein n=1 Tax=Cronbergia sp. UHCC 0137 TaxID=3110239 RepID=UPI002B216BB5|nr:hypothetical protein [Cronbergia sp. UHCC 0137]MEA5619594.1 hypothetical protein [Cronbergia sp. UHCC 0137]